MVFLCFCGLFVQSDITAFCKSGSEEAKSFGAITFAANLHRKKGYKVIGK